MYKSEFEKAEFLVDVGYVKETKKENPENNFEAYLHLESTGDAQLLGPIDLYNSSRAIVATFKTISVEVYSPKQTLNGCLTISPFILNLPVLSSEEFDEVPVPKAINLESNCFLSCEGFSLNFNFAYAEFPPISYVEEIKLKFGEIKGQMPPSTLQLILMYVENIFFGLFENEDDFPLPMNVNYTAQSFVDYKKKFKEMQKKLSMRGRGGSTFNPNSMKSSQEEIKSVNRDKASSGVHKEEPNDNIVDVWYQNKLSYFVVTVEIGKAAINLVTKRSIFQIQVLNKVYIEMNKHINHLYHDNITVNIPFVYINQYIPVDYKKKIDSGSFETVSDCQQYLKGEWAIVTHVRFGMKANVLEEADEWIENSQNQASFISESDRDTKRAHIYHERLSVFPRTWNIHDTPLPDYKMENLMGTLCNIEIPEPPSGSSMLYENSIIRFTPINKTPKTFQMETNVLFQDDKGKEEIDEPSARRKTPFEEDNVMSDHSWLFEQASKNATYFADKNKPATSKEPATEGNPLGEDFVKKKVGYDIRLLPKTRVCVTPFTVETLSEVLDTFSHDIGSVDALFDTLQKDLITKNFFHERWTHKHFMVAVSVPQVNVGLFSNFGRDLQAQLMIEKAVARAPFIVKWNLKETLPDSVHTSNFSKCLKKLDLDLDILSIEAKIFPEASFNDNKMKDYKEYVLVAPKADLTRIVIRQPQATASFSKEICNAKASLELIDVKISESLPLHLIKFVKDWFIDLKVLNEKLDTFTAKRKDQKMQLIGAILYRLIKLKTTADGLKIEDPSLLYTNLSPLKHNFLGRLATHQRNSWLDLCRLRFYFNKLFGDAVSTVRKELNHVEHIESPAKYYMGIWEQFKNSGLLEKEDDLHLKQMIESSVFLHDLFQLKPEDVSQAQNFSNQYKKITKIIQNPLNSFIISPSIDVITLDKEDEDKSERSERSMKTSFADSKMFSLEEDEESATASLVILSKPNLSLQASFALPKIQISVGETAVKVGKIEAGLKLVKQEVSAKKNTFVVFLEPSFNCPGIHVDVENNLVPFLLDAELILEEIDQKEQQFLIERSSPVAVKQEGQSPSHDTQLSFKEVNFNLDKVAINLCSESGVVEFNIEKILFHHFLKTEPQQASSQFISRISTLPKEPLKKGEIETQESLFTITSIKLVVTNPPSEKDKVFSREREIASLVLRKFEVNGNSRKDTKKVINVILTSVLQQVELQFNITQGGKLKKFANEWTKELHQAVKERRQQKAMERKREQIYKNKKQRTKPVQVSASSPNLKLKCTLNIEKVSVSTDSVEGVSFKYSMPLLELAVKHSTVKKPLGETKVLLKVPEHRQKSFSFFLRVADVYLKDDLWQCQVRSGTSLDLIASRCVKRNSGRSQSQRIHLLCSQQGLSFATDRLFEGAVLQDGEVHLRRAVQKYSPLPLQHSEADLFADGKVPQVFRKDEEQAGAGDTQEDRFQEPLFRGD